MGTKTSRASTVLPKGRHKTPATFTQDDSQHRNLADREHLDSTVALTLRRSPLTMGLLWMTMVTGFPCVLMGFEWHKAGLSLTEIIIGTITGSLLLLAYLVPASLLGAHSGQSFAALCKPVFGKLGARLATANIIWIFLGWYGVLSLFLADALTGLFHPPLTTPVLAFILALLMSGNNLFGFKGVANFARYFAAPVILTWVGYTFFKAVAHTDVLGAFQFTGQVSIYTAITTTASFIIGFAVWGNEPDYWRFGHKKTFHTIAPLALAVTIGQIIFPITGWLVAQATGISDSATATAFLNDYSFGGLTFVVALVLVAAYFAPSDSTIYGMTAALANNKKSNHRQTVVVLALIGGSLSYWLAQAGTAKALQSICELNAIVLPPATVILLTEWLLQRVIWRESPFFEQATQDLPLVRWPAVAALLLGIFAGVITSGIVPSTQFLNCGIPPLLAWLVSASTYTILRLLERARRPVGNASLDHLAN